MRKVNVLPYDAKWPVLFAKEAAGIKRILDKELLAIHHFGSTSVPGLAAKSIIDILAVVKEIGFIDDLNGEFRKIGYEGKGENGIAGRRYFQKGGDDRTHHLHIYQIGSPEIERHLVFRDYLRSHPDVAREYGELKRNLSRQFPYDIDSYINGKEGLASAIQAQALTWQRSQENSDSSKEQIMTSFIFDMDGTLFQTDKILELALRDTFDRLRTLNLWESATPIEKYREIMGVPLPKVWEELLPEHSLEVREEANEFFHDRLIWNIENGNGALYPNVEKLFGHLKSKGHAIYIASNGLTAYLAAIVEFYRLDCWVTETFSIQQISSLDKGDLVGSIKQKYRIRDGAVIGDRLSDINAAKANNLTAIGCRFDFSQEEELAQADFVIEDLLELMNLNERGMINAKKTGQAR